MRKQEYERLKKVLMNNRFTAEQKQELISICYNLNTEMASKNIQGQHIGKDVSGTIDNLIKENWKDIAIAKYCGVSKTTVLRHRKKMEQQANMYEKYMSREYKEFRRQMEERERNGELPF